MFAHSKFVVARRVFAPLPWTIDKIIQYQKSLVMKLNASYIRTRVSELMKKIFFMIWQKFNPNSGWSNKSPHMNQIPHLCGD